MTWRSETRIAVVEDDPVMGGSLLQRLTLEGYDACWWDSGGEAVAALEAERPDLLICDIRLPDFSGEELYRRLAGRLGATPVLFITGHGEIDQAVRLMRAGAADYLTKPFAMGDFLERIESLLARCRPASPDEAEAEAALGPSEGMRGVTRLLRQVADIDSTLLITGESGVGKEVAARHLHAISARAAAPFVAVNCAAIPAELIESEIFGHEKGAFTGAHQRHLGVAERAGTGILFLDEIGELSPELQGKLLRVVQERAFYRLGGERLQPFRARLICASNRDLEAMVAEGGFRRDLYYRLNVIPLEVPPLRQRRADIKPLLGHYLGVTAEAFGREVRGLTTLAEELALEHDWPGNVRELCNRVERAVALAGDPLLGPADLFPELSSPGEESAEAAGPLATLREARDAAERRQIERALKETGGQLQKAAALLGVSRTTLWEKMRRLGLGEERERPGA